MTPAIFECIVATHLLCEASSPEAERHRRRVRARPLKLCLNGKALREGSDELLKDRCGPPLALISHIQSRLFPAPLRISPTGSTGRLWPLVETPLREINVDFLIAKVIK